ncbi:hypothetical protein CALCODRAFT_450615, partial [Calocera cornea HHB12733]
MDRIKERLASLRTEADAAAERAEVAEKKNKDLEQTLLQKDHEISSLQHQLGLAQDALEKAEAKLAETKGAADEGESNKKTNENLTRKVQLLEEELDTAEKNMKETVEKLRQVDVKAEHFERQVTHAEQERDAWEKKYEVRPMEYLILSPVLNVLLGNGREVQGVPEGARR